MTDSEEKLKNMLQDKVIDESKKNELTNLVRRNALLSVQGIAQEQAPSTSN